MILAAPDGNVFDRELLAGEKANEEGAEEPPQYDVIKFVHHDNAGNFDQCYLQFAPKKSK